MNEMRIDSPRLQPPVGAQGDAASARGSEGGRFRGEQLQWLAPQGGGAGGVTTDNAEEISLHLAEAAEDEAFDDESVEARQDPQVMSAEQVLGYLQAVHQQGKTEELVALARRMLASGAHPGVMARQGLPDPTQQFLALQYALQQGEREGAPAERLQALRDALADLDDDHGASIRARLNTAAVIGGQAADADGAARLQQTYTELVLGAPTLARSFDLALQHFGTQGLGSGLQGLIAALGADLAAARPSTSMVRLQALLQDLYLLEVVQTSLDGAQALASGLEQRHGHRGLDAERLLRELVALTAERWVTAQRFESLAEQLGVADGPARIGLLTGIKALLRELPPRVFVDAESRQTAFDALQGALDAAIAREEEGT